MESAVSSDACSSDTQTKRNDFLLEIQELHHIQENVVANSTFFLTTLCAHPSFHAEFRSSHDMQIPPIFITEAKQRKNTRNKKKKKKEKEK